MGKQVRYNGDYYRVHICRFQSIAGQSNEIPLKITGENNKHGNVNHSEDVKDDDSGKDKPDNTKMLTEYSKNYSEHNCSKDC